MDNKELRRLVINHQVNTDYQRHGGFMGTDLDKKRYVSMSAYFLLVYGRTLGRPEIEKTMAVFKNVIEQRGIMVGGLP